MNTIAFSLALVLSQALNTIARAEPTLPTFQQRTQEASRVLGLMQAILNRRAVFARLREGDNSRLGFRPPYHFAVSYLEGQLLGWINGHEINEFDFFDHSGQPLEPAALDKELDVVFEVLTTSRAVVLRRPNSSEPIRLPAITTLQTLAVRDLTLTYEAGKLLVSLTHQPLKILDTEFLHGACGGLSPNPI